MKALEFERPLSYCKNKVFFFMAEFVQIFANWNKSV